VHRKSVNRPDEAARFVVRQGVNTTSTRHVPTRCGPSTLVTTPQSAVNVTQSSENVSDVPDWCCYPGTDPVLQNVLTDRGTDDGNISQPSPARSGLSEGEHSARPDVRAGERTASPRRQREKEELPPVRMTCQVCTRPLRTRATITAGCTPPTAASEGGERHAG
jgi:hypothetical protein